MARMSAREELLEMLRHRQPGPWVARPEDDAAIAAFRDEVLREAAEKIRKKASVLDGWPRGRYWRGYIKGSRSAADLIDPQMK
jgi:hypothetical protein